MDNTKPNGQNGPNEPNRQIRQFVTLDLLEDFATELMGYVFMKPNQIAKITSNDAMDLAKKGRGIPLYMTPVNQNCTEYFNNFIDIGGLNQLHEYIKCEQYNRFVRRDITPNPN